MDSKEKEEYLSWVGVLNRTRSTRRIKRPKKIVVEEEEYDAREELEKMRKTHKKVTSEENNNL